ncbi:hypothetical protein Hanom_Chr03g00219691 [Helianthus anomalus]
MEESEMMTSFKFQLLVVSFYKFADFPDHVVLRKPLKSWIVMVSIHTQRLIKLYGP